MKIEKLKLENFRNYETLELDFHEGTNLFYGDNAQGKTNILESVYLCGTTKSHKSSKDKDMIQFQKDESHIRMILCRHDTQYQIDMHLKKNRAKGIAINGVPIRKASELIGLGNYVFFSPEDLNIIKNGPSERRRFMDMELCQLNRLYVQLLSGYNRILLQRNKLLKDIYFHPEYQETLDIWDQQMVHLGCQLIRERSEFVKKLNEVIYGIHKKLTRGQEELFVSYEKNADEEEFEQKLRESREKDLKMKMSCTGPHRDDLFFGIHHVDIRKFGSQGQQRTTALSLKLAEIELVKQTSGDTPILLMDDVLSELDSRRQHDLLDSIHDIQTMITCTGIDDFVENKFRIDRLFKVVKGTVSTNEGNAEAFSQCE